MRTFTTKHTVYKFSELGEEAQDEAIEALQDINLQFDWWDTTYEDAEMIGLKITGFDTYHRDIDGHLTESLQDVCKLIMENHGESCDTYQLAKQWQHKHGEDNEEQFCKLLLEEYLSILDKEYEYLGSREAIIETIEANEYEFYKDGKLA